ncbi:hypothetical protein BDN71DRAFT_1436391 [Pleurotus eryngii]|uniref:Uncharacterized protein n=1 Tax=Pleurotus eryngii TaxID=5323 RepID=A0A9P6D8X4_PLEER|nr:hypothetical protein BDN71DRAFT_1436391 [Pleurotus eryngii]
MQDEFLDANNAKLPLHLLSNVVSKFGYLHIPASAHMQANLWVADLFPSWLRLAASTKVKFYSITNGLTWCYIELLYNKYTTNYWSDAFSNAIIELEALHGSIWWCEEALLQLTGIGREFRVAEAVGKLVNEGLRCVEEITCYASIGKGEVCELYEK